MHIPSRSAFIAATMALIAIAPQAWAQTPAQMEYERQQREYRQQQERQQQEQQRQQQLTNENARRQQEESRRLNAPMGQSPAPGYQGATPQRATPQSATPQSRPRIDATAETAAAKWEDLGSLPANGGVQIYFDHVTKRRSGALVKMWEMWDFKTPQLIDGKRFLSVKNQYEYDCKGSRVRMLATAGYSGHMGKGAVVGAGEVPFAWQAVSSGNYQGQLWKIVCAKS